MELSRSSLPDQVFHRLAADVLAGRFAPGERLPTQRALAASLGVNMASVREGIKRLEQLKLVEVRHGDAMRVRDWRAHGRLAGEVAAAESDEAAQGADFAFFATLIAASGNLVLLLVANSIRDLYFARLADFRALVRDRDELAS